MNKIIFILSITLVFASCSTMTPRRGANAVCNCFYSSYKPNVKITLADNYYLYKKNEQPNRMDYQWKDKDGYMWVYMDYLRNNNIENTVDYYYAIDKVLYNSYGLKNKNIGYGFVMIHGYKFYYCDYIKSNNKNRIYLIRHMVLPSWNHDWVAIRLGHTITYKYFDEEFSTANDYFKMFPENKEIFYKKISEAIKKIEPFDETESFKTIPDANQ